MAKDLFESTIQENNPGLVYSTPKSMPAGYNSLGGIAEGLNTIIPAIDQYNKTNVEREAADLANELSSEYLMGSETHLNNLTQEKTRLQSELDAGNGNSGEILDQLNQLEGKLNNARDQGAIGPGEFKHRMRKAAQDLTNDNPAYQMEIANKMNAVFGSTGINDILANDSVLLKTRADALIARRVLKTKLVEQYEDTTGMSAEQIDDHYAFFKKHEGVNAQAKLMIDTLKNKDNATKQKAYQVFVENGGYQTLSDSLYTNAVGTVRAIGAMDIPINKKIQQTNDYLNRQINMLAQTASVLPTEAKEGTYITTNLINQIKAIKTEMLEEENQTAALKSVENSVKLLVGQQSYNLHQRYNIPEIDMQVKITKILENIKSSSEPVMKLNHQIRDTMIYSLSKQVQGGGYGLTNNSEGVSELTTPNGANMLSQLTIAMRDNAKKDLKENGKLTDGNVQLYVSSLSLPRTSLSKDTLLSHYDKYLYDNIMSTDEKVMDTLEQYPEYNTEVDNALSAYTAASLQSLRQIIGDNTVSVSFNKTNSSLFIKQDDPIRVNQPGAVTRFQNNLQRVNRLIRMNAKISGKSLEEEAKKILEEDFNTVLKAE